MERGFSVNESLLVENLQERSLISQRVVFDAVQEAGDVLAVDITDDMIKSVHNSHARYTDALEEQRKMVEKETEKAVSRKRTQDAIKELQAKRRKLDEDYKAAQTVLTLQLAEMKNKTS